MSTFTFTEQTAPATPTTAKVVIYAKADGNMYQKDDAGTETALAGGGSGTVTSVGLSTNASYLTVGATPVTTSGTITINKTTALTANQVVATPDGVAGVADLRALVVADLPTITEAKGGTNQTTYATGDTLYGSAANTLSKLAIGSTGQVLTVAGGIPSWATPAGGTADNSLCGGRLTLTSATPVTIANVTAATTIYFTPWNGNLVSLYNGSAWVTSTFTERSLSLSGFTADSNYDIFLYDNSGTLTLEALIWTNNTTRATALVYQDGVYCKTGALTRRYLGTIRITASTGQCEDSVSKRYVFNNMNRVPRRLSRTDTTNTWTYATANTFRPANNDSTNNRISLVSGLADHFIDVTVMGLCFAAQASVTTVVGIGIDSTSANSAQASTLGGSNSVSQILSTMSSKYSDFLAVGSHIIYPLEAQSVATSFTWYGDNNLTLGNTGIIATVWS